MPDSLDAPAISVTELHQKVDSGKDVYLLDVRTYEEWYTERLACTVDLIPYDMIPVELDRLPLDKNAEMYMFCRSGRRSAIVTNYLRSVGYANVYNVAGGILAWKGAGYETISGAAG